MTLAELFTHYGTDRQRYADMYECLLRGRRQHIRAVLEIGIGSLEPIPAHKRWRGFGSAAPHYRPGGGLRAWRDYFPATQVMGVDVALDTQFSEERISTVLCDSTDATAMARMGLPGFDLIIDDGAHDCVDQLATLRNCWPHLLADGLYVIEDMFADWPADWRSHVLAICGPVAAELHEGLMIICPLR